MDYQLEVVSWQDENEALCKVRREVFIEEQHVPEELEWDEYDENCRHVLVTDTNHHPIATGRIKPDGHIGRMAVLKNWRNRGIGHQVLEKLLACATEAGIERVYLHAQVSAIPFYEKLGFELYSEVFMDAGIPHRSMQKRLVP